MGTKFLSESGAKKLMSVVKADITAESAIVGKHKNLLASTLVSTSQNGITCTRTEDGSYTLNGSAEDLTLFTICKDVPLSNAKYNLTGCPSGGSTATFYLTASLQGELIDSAADVGEGNIFTYSNNLYDFCIVVAKGANLSNVIFKPMLSSDITLTYADYTPSPGHNSTLIQDTADLHFDLFTAAGYSIDLNIDSETYVMTLNLKNKQGDVIDSDSIDFPIESMVIDATYKDGKLILKLQSGKTIEVPISALIDGLVKVSDIVDNLNSTDTKKPLSANMGRALKESIKDGVLTIKKNDTQVTTFSANQSTNAEAKIVVNDGKLTIKRNDVELGTFTADQATASNINISVPTKLSELTNDVVKDGKLTLTQNDTFIGDFTANQGTDETINITVPTKLSEFTNDVVNDGKLTIQKNGTDVASFTANDADNVTANVVVNNGKFTVKRNGTELGSFTADQSTNNDVNIETYSVTILS